MSTVSETASKSRRTRAAQLSELCRGRAGTLRMAALDAELVGVRVLTADQTIELADQGQRLANRCGYPLDIEFAYAGGTLQLLQARPITALPAPAPQSDEEEWLWDDANIQESFCGVTLPLTFSFFRVEGLPTCVYLPW